MIISPQTSFAKKYSRRRILKKERKNGGLLAIGAYNIYTMGNTGGVCTG